MSVRVMAAVWGVPLPDSEKLVLLALADCANDEGACWPSMKTLADKCTKSDRTVQAAIKSLVEKGHLSRIEKPGKGCMYYVHPVQHHGMEGSMPTANHYTYRITCAETGEFYVGARSCYDAPSVDKYMGSGEWVKAAKASGLTLRKEVLGTYPSREALGVAEQELTKAVIGNSLCRNKKVASAKTLSPFAGLTPEAASPRNRFAPKPAAGTPEAVSDKPSMNHHSMEIENAPADFPQEAWVGFAKMRKAMKRPLTDRAVVSLLAKLEKLKAKGHDPGEVLDQSTMHNWIGVFEIKDDGNGKDIRTGGAGRNAGGDKRSGLARAIDRHIGIGV